MTMEYCILYCVIIYVIYLSLLPADPRTKHSHYNIFTLSSACHVGTNEPRPTMTKEIRLPVSAD